MDYLSFCYLFMKKLFLILSSFGVILNIYTQTFLVLEQAGKIRTNKFPVGAEIRVHFKGEPNSMWYDYNIWDIEPKNNCIRVSDSFCFNINTVDRFDIAPDSVNKWSKLFGKFFVQWTGFSLAQLLFKPPLYPFHFAVAGCAAVGYLFSKIINPSQIKINRRHRLKIIDLTVDKPRA